MTFWKLCAAADRAMRRMPAPDLPPGWDAMSIGSLWDALNDPRRHGTPQSTIEAILYCVRQRGAAALTEPANIARLARCDDKAKAQIRLRTAKLLELEAI